MNLKINKKKLFYLGRWIDNVLDTDFWSHWNEAEAIRKITRQYCSGDRLSIDGHFYHSQEMQDAVSQESFRMAQGGKFGYFENYNVVARQVTERLMKKRQALMQKRKFSVEDLQEFFKEFQPLFAIWMIMFPISEGLERSIRLRLRKRGLDLDDVRPLFKSAKDTEIVKQHKEMIKIAAEIKKTGAAKIFAGNNIKIIDANLRRKHPEIYKKIKKHHQKYGWLGVHHFWGSPMTFAKLLKELRSEIGQRPVAKEASEKIVVPSDVARLIGIMNLLAYWRFRCAELSGYYVYGVWPQLHDLARRLGVAYNELYWFNRDEIVSALNKNARLNKNTAKIRAKGFAYISIGKSKDKIITGKKMKALLKEMMPNQRGNITEIKGVTASPGAKVKGRVRLVLDPNAVRKFKRGEVLVSPETTPDFVPAMKLASAIITDIGGLTSHAAIVSRELKKPCIIATKIATQVLHDGDLVEVDADKGEVKVLRIK